MLEEASSVTPEHWIPARFPTLVRARNSGVELAGRFHVLDAQHEMFKSVNSHSFREVTEVSSISG